MWWYQQQYQPLFVSRFLYKRNPYWSHYWSRHLWISFVGQLFVYVFTKRGKFISLQFIPLKLKHWPEGGRFVIFSNPIKTPQQSKRYQQFCCCCYWRRFFLNQNWNVDNKIHCSRFYSTSSIYICWHLVCTIGIQNSEHIDFDA